MQWIKLTSGALVHYIPLDKIQRLQVSGGSTLSIFTTASTVANFPVTDWNNGRLLDDTFTDTGSNPLQV